MKSCLRKEREKGVREGEKEQRETERKGKAGRTKERRRRGRNARSQCDSICKSHQSLSCGSPHTVCWHISRPVHPLILRREKSYDGKVCILRISSKNFYKWLKSIIYTKRLTNNGPSSTACQKNHESFRLCTMEPCFCRCSMRLRRVWYGTSHLQSPQ